MAKYQAIENNNILVNLLLSANDTGWTVSDGIGRHSDCNTGYITLVSYPVTAGKSYKITYAVPSISSGFIQAEAGNMGGIVRSTPDIYVETITATVDGFIKFLANGVCTLMGFAVKDVTVNDGLTIAWSAKSKKWSDRRTMYPDIGLSLYEVTIQSREGAIYVQENGSDDRNNFFGEDFQSSIKIVDAKAPGLIHDYDAVNYQCNMLMVSTIDGISTPLGQVSTLLDTDFTKEILSSGGQTKEINQFDQVYSASLLPDANDDAVNGAQMRGNYIIVELETVDASTPLKLLNIGLRSTRVPIGIK